MSDYILPIAAPQTPSQPSVPHQCLSVDQSPTREPISENQRQSAAKKNRPQIIARGVKRGRDRLILLPPVDDADSISQNTGFDEEKTKFHPRSNQRNGPSRHGPQGSIRN